MRVRVRAVIQFRVMVRVSYVAAQPLKVKVTVRASRVAT